MSATTSARDAEPSFGKRQHQERSRRQSLPSNLPSSSRRRMSGLAISDGTVDFLGSRPVSQAGPHVQFASPPYMPMYGAASSSSSDAHRRSMPPIGSTASISSLNSLATPSRSGRPGHVRTESSRLRRRLARWTSWSKPQDGGLEFGCAGTNDWSEGPVDMSDRYYSPYRGTANRGSFSSSAGSTSAAGWSHSRGESTSSTFSTVSTAPSSAPNSPTMRAAAKQQAVPSSSAGEGTVTPRTAERMRSEAAAVEAVDEYFRRMRLAAPEASSTSSTSGAFSFPQRPLSSAPTSIDVELARSTKSDHKRSLSDELQIQFIETGHTTFTPFSASQLDDDDQSSLVLSNEDLSDDGDHSTYVLSEVTPIPPALFEIPEEYSGSNSTATTARPSLAVPDLVVVDGVEEDLVPALEELSDYFASTLSVEAIERDVVPVPQPAEWIPVPIEPLSPRRRVATKPEVPDLSKFAFPPKAAATLSPSPPPGVSHARGGSASSLPVIASAPAVGLEPPQGHRRGQSASFAAAERGKLVAAGQLKPSLAEQYLLRDRNVLYNWI
ncbi:hypothetical protein BMF94_3284 [Rhodotorula taiwanensis]|uniref:Uncharacterized protein n=1 Tax=Rhodotorula taiwanensis TaxID=741276 RepID=A0A2S5BAF0_9BASI|nr:hypothetical protein BMF94_3284 [Rhodotorula taiwanensis]